MLHTPLCFRYNGDPVTYEWLQGIYQFGIHEGDDGQGGVHIPANASKFYYPTHIWERNAKAEIHATAPAPLRYILPYKSDVERDGTFDIEPATMQSFGYQPKKGEHGPLGLKVEDGVWPSAYIDGIGLAFNAHRLEDLPNSETEGNNYMTVMVRFGLIERTPGSNPNIPVTAPATPNSDEVRIPRSFLLEVKRHAAASADMDSEITKYLNQAPS